MELVGRATAIDAPDPLGAALSSLSAPACRQLITERPPRHPRSPASPPEVRKALNGRSHREFT